MLTPQIVENILEMISTPVKKYTGNCSDTPFGPEYCTSSKESQTSLSNQLYLTFMENKCFFLLKHSLITFMIMASIWNKNL